MKLAKLFVVALLVNISFAAFSYSQSSARSSGPEKGTLFIVGGGGMSDRLVRRFIELGGGVEGKFVVVPTALGRETYDERRLNFLKRRGVKNVVLMHTNDRKVADSAEFVKPLEDATAVWFGGGRQWRLVDSYKGTRTEKMFWKVLERGGVIGGSSAGATIQGSYLARGDTKNNQIMMGDHEEGFGFLTNTAIDQHTLARNRHFDMFDILRNKPELLGLSIDEGTAVIVRQNQFEVRGRSYALVYDGNFWSREGTRLKTIPPANRRFYFLRDGDRYNLTTRQVIPRRRGAN